MLKRKYFGLILTLALLSAWSALASCRNTNIAAYGNEFKELQKALPLKSPQYAGNWKVREVHRGRHDACLPKLPAPQFSIKFVRKDFDPGEYEPCLCSKTAAYSFYDLEDVARIAPALKRAFAENPESNLRAYSSPRHQVVAEPCGCRAGPDPDCAGFTRLVGEKLRFKK